MQLFSVAVNVPSHVCAVVLLRDSLCGVATELALKIGQPSLLTLPPSLSVLSSSLFAGSQRTVVGFCPVLPASAAEGNHCLVLLPHGLSMGLFVPSV